MDTGANIEAVRQELGRSLLILGHHYQRQSVLKHVDETGDSLELSRKAGESEAERIVFCGVRFMAESADILSSPGQKVYMPASTAGCPMADMATEPQMRQAWDRLAAVSNNWLPVVYVNSSAEIKSCCGELGGSTCTSSNARKVFEWAFAQGRRILFLPDEHLACNTARDLGIPDSETAVYDPAVEDGGLTDGDISSARVVAWKGFCIVHLAFTVEQVEAVRNQRPDAKIIIHPEAPRDAVALCDEHGSTSRIIDYVDSAPDGSCVVVGTEVNLVERLAMKHKGRIEVKALAPSVCANMARTNVENLNEVLSSWPEARVVSVGDDVKANARLALERMLSIR